MYKKIVEIEKSIKTEIENKKWDWNIFERIAPSRSLKAGFCVVSSIVLAISTYKFFKKSND